MRVRTKRLVVVASVAVLLAAAASWAIPELSPRYRTAVALVESVEEFRRIRGRLPLSHEELDPSITESGPAYYELQGPRRYTVHFGLSLGESYTYDSSTGQWH
jgi:hypothetical protein